MANSLRLTLRSFYHPLKNEILKISPRTTGVRYLYAKTTLGIDGFEDHKREVRLQLSNMEEKFREKMTSYAAEDSTGMIFTEDLKNMTHLAENDADFDLVIQMAKKFNKQNKQLRFGSFVFGPVLMRMFHVYRKPDLALQAFKLPELDGIFDQLISYQILLDLLYESGKYNEILEAFEIIKNKQLEGSKNPRNVVVLVMAACYKLNSPESAEYALKLWNELLAIGHFPMRRATTFCAGLALNQGKAEVALEIISGVKKPNYMTIRNLKAKALSQIGRLEDAILLLKSIISEDFPRGVTATFNRDVLEAVRDAVKKSDNLELNREFDKLEKLFENEGHISEMTLDYQLCSEIQQPPVIHNRNRQGNRFSRFSPDESRDDVRPFKKIYRRPGLTDVYD